MGQVQWRLGSGFQVFYARGAAFPATVCDNICKSHVASQGSSPLPSCPGHLLGFSHVDMKYLYD